MNGTKFAIGICVGDRDYVGTEGADEVVRSNAFFQTGESQLFVLPNAGHLLHIQNPMKLAQTMIDFFTGTILGKFEQKARADFTPAQPINYPKL